MAIKPTETPNGINGVPTSKETPVKSKYTAVGRKVSMREEEPASWSMTGIRTGLFSSLFVKIGLGLLIVIFAVGFALSGLGPVSNLGGGPSGGTRRGADEPVARVGDQTISNAMFQNMAARQEQMMAQFGQPTGPEQLLTMRQNVLEQMAGEAATYIEAKKAGLTATDKEVDAKIDEYLNDQLKPQAGQSEAAVRRNIEAQAGSIDAFKAEQRKNYDRDLVARQIVLDKFEKQFKANNKVTEDDYKKSVTSIGLRQIKISPKPDVKAKDFKAAMDKAQAAAKAKAEKLAAQLKNADAAKFAAAAKANSDDPLSKTKGGDVGSKPPAQLPYSLEINKAIADSKSNFVGPLQDERTGDWYLFTITGRKLELPKDYAKNKATTLKTFEEQKDNDAWSTYQAKLKEQNPPEILDPALAAYDLQNKKLYAAQGDEQKKLRQQVIEKYQGALASAAPEEATAIRYQLAQQYAQAGDRDKQIETLKAALEGGGDLKMLRADYARALLDAKKNDEALKQVQELSKSIDENPAPPSPFGGGNPDDAMRMQTAQLYEQLGKKDLADKERAKVKPAAPGGMGGLNFGGMGGGSQTMTIPAPKQ